MFLDDPFALLNPGQIEAQVSELLGRYRAGVSAAVGHEGQSLAAFLEVEEQALAEEGTFEVLMDSGLGEVVWVWVHDVHVVFLSHWHEDKDLPIDLEFSRAPLALFEAARKRLSEAYEM
jgi:hypothetical protein